MAEQKKSSKLLFFTLLGDNEKIQIIAEKESYSAGEFDKIMGVIKRGDIIGVKGNPGQSKTGELTLRA
jgi:lysyl-tRNA synthetase class 2